MLKKSMRDTHDLFHTGNTGHVINSSANGEFFYVMDLHHIELTWQINLA
jgi:hypothetical protein